MAAGIATLEGTEREDFYQELSDKSQYLMNGFKQAADKAGIPLLVKSAGGMFGFFFTEAQRVDSFAKVMKCDTDRFAKFFHLMLDNGVYLAPSAFEAGFMSDAHTYEDLDKTIVAAEIAFGKL